MKPSPLLYFGCVKRTGHFLYGPYLQPLRHEPDDYPPSLHCGLGPGARLDGKFCDKSNNTQGRARVHHVEGWTILAFWDFSIDQRGGSNSVFLCPGTFTFGEMRQKARTVYPDVWARYTFEVYDGWPQQRGSEATKGPDYPKCQADRDGDCTWHHCPQLREGEPYRSGRSCPKYIEDPET